MAENEKEAYLALIAAHDNAFNRQVLEGDALYFSSPGNIADLVDDLSPELAAADMKKRNREKIAERFNWPDIIAHYERFIHYSLSTKNERNILYRRYPG